MKVMSLLSLSDFWFLNYRDYTSGVVCEVPSVGCQSFKVSVLILWIDSLKNVAE